MSDAGAARPSKVHTTRRLRRRRAWLPWLFVAIVAGCTANASGPSSGPGGLGSGTPRGMGDAGSPSSGASGDGGGTPSDAAVPALDSGDGDASQAADGRAPGDAAADAAHPDAAAHDAASDASPSPDACSPTTPVAFPGAVGFGALATGGRGNAAVHVTNLNDTGAGSFRDAVGASHRTVVFDVGGVVNLASAVSVSSDVTIAGQTAPGGGIAIEGREVSFSNASNVIVRHVRFRQGTNDPDTGKSVIAADASTSLIFDHVSVEFGQWDNMDINSGMGVTIQRSIIADPIGQQFNAHCTSGDLTWYRDVFSSAHNRSPLAKGNSQFIENVVYNFQAGYTAGDSSGTFMHDIAGSYFISGPSTTNAGDAYFQMNNQSVFQTGDALDDNRDGTLNGAALGLPGGSTALAAPWAPTTSTLATASAAAAYANDVASAGALPHDDVDALVLADVTSLGKTGHLWTSQSQTGLANGGYGTLAGGTPPVDSDGDGIPDAWETSHGLNPHDPADAVQMSGCTGYTNLEAYINDVADSL